MTDTEQDLLQAVIRTNGFIDDLIDLQEAQQVALNKILQSLQDYQRALSELYNV